MRAVHDEELAAVGAVVGRIAVGLVGREEEPITGIGADDEEGGTWLGVKVARFFFVLALAFSPVMSRSKRSLADDRSSERASPFPPRDATTLASLRKSCGSIDCEVSFELIESCNG